MNKKTYEAPRLRTFCLGPAHQLLSGSVNGVDGVNTGITYGGGGSGPARSRQRTGWDDDDE